MSFMILFEMKAFVKFTLLLQNTFLILCFPYILLFAEHH